MPSVVETFLTEDELPPSPNRTWPRRIAAAATVAALLAGGVYTWNQTTHLINSTNTEIAAGVPVTVIVRHGDTLTKVAAAMKDAGVIQSASNFTNLAAAEKVQVQPGVYTLTTGASVEAALAQVLDPANRAADLTLPEGLTETETIEVTAERTSLPISEVAAAVNNATKPEWATTAHGLLYPATYEIIPGEDAQAVIDRMVTRFEQTSNDIELVKNAKKAGYTPQEIVTIASLIEAEGRPKDFRKVSAVIHNRLKQDMKLQFDSTVNYILGIDTFDLDATDTSTVSPYNTYLNYGLPPGPINSPGQAALEAALNPAKGPWLYFVTTNPDTGKTEFTDKYEQFLKWKAEFVEKYR